MNKSHNQSNGANGNTNAIRTNYRDQQAIRSIQARRNASGCTTMVMLGTCIIIVAAAVVTLLVLGGVTLPF